MKLTLATLLVATTLAGGAVAQTAPVGGPDAKGNSPVKAVHTVNDGAAKPAANSFTQGQAAKHIETSGYTAVSGLVKGPDGVWRGSAMKNGAPVNVAMDFKGNVTEGMSQAPMPKMLSPTRTTSTAAESATPVAAPSGMAPHHHGMGSKRHHRHSHHAHHHHSGVGMSGVDRNKNGISDKEDHALRH